MGPGPAWGQDTQTHQLSATGTGVWPVPVPGMGMGVSPVPVPVPVPVPGSTGGPEGEVVGGRVGGLVDGGRVVVGSAMTTVALVMLAFPLEPVELIVNV